MKKIMAYIIVVFFVLASIGLLAYAKASDNEARETKNESSQKDWQNIQVYRRGLPDRPYKELGVVKAVGGPDTENAVLIADLKNQAAAMGADAIIIRDVGKQLAGQSPRKMFCPDGQANCVVVDKRQDTKVSASAVAIKFKD